MGMGLITPYPFFMPNIEDILEEVIKQERRASSKLRQQFTDENRTNYANARFGTDEALMVLASEIHGMRQIISNYENQKQAGRIVPQYKNVEPLDQ